jgi:hypothetical protein
MPWPLSTPRKDPVPTVQEAGWDPGLVWMGVENLASTGIRSLDRPAHSQSLYRLSYVAHMKMIKHNIVVCCYDKILLNVATYSRTLDCEQLGLRVFYKTSKNFEGILT